jgi:hypothetical protein
MQGYKIVIKLKNGARVSCLIPKEVGMRKTYHANGKPLPVDEGMIFDTYNAAEGMLNRGGTFFWWKSGTELEIWSCNYTDHGAAPTRVLGAVSELRKHTNYVIKLIGNVFTGKGKNSVTNRIELSKLGIDIPRHVIINATSPPIFPTGTIFAKNITLVKMLYSQTI